MTRANHGSARDGRRPLTLVALAMTFNLAMAMLDAGVGERAVLTGTLVIAPFALATVELPRRVALVAALSVLLALGSGVWNDYFLAVDHVVRLLIVTTGGGLAVLAAVVRRSAEEARQQADQARARMELLAEAGRISDDTGRVEEGLERLAGLLVPSVGDLCMIDVVEEHGATRRAAVRWEGPGGSELEYRLRRRAPSGAATTSLLAAAAAGEGRLHEEVTPEQLDVTAADPADRRLLAGVKLRSAITMPLRAGDEVVGVIGLATGPSARRYGLADLEFAEVLAGRAALALANARLIKRLRAAQERLDGILGGLAEAVTVHDAEGNMVFANPAAAALLGLGSPEAVVAAEQRELADRFVITREDGSPVALEDFPGARAMIGHEPEPLLTRSVERHSGRERWLLTKASLVHDDRGEPMAVNVIEDVTEAKEAERRQRFLAEAGEVLASSLDYQETLERVARLAVPTLADWCGVDVLDNRGAPEQVALAHVDPGKVAFGRRLRERYPVDMTAPTGLPNVLRTGESELYPDIGDERLVEAAVDEEHLEIIRALGMRAAMIVPMRTPERTIGAITLVSSESERTFCPDDLAFAEDLARRAAVAVENSRLYTERAHAARTLQESLLPQRLLDPPGWRTAARYRAGEEGSEVGGDFYDLCPVDRGWMAVIGDVTGKGVGAAALTALARHTMVTAALFDPRPSAVLSLLNRVLRRQVQLSLLTAACVRLEVVGGAIRATVGAAGHPLPLRVRAGEVVEIGRHDPLVGAFDGERWHDSVAFLEPGDTLLLYTDGVTDTRGADRRFGEERLHSVVAAGSAEPEALVTRIETGLRDFQHGHLSDDTALMALQIVSVVDEPAATAAPASPGEGGRPPR
jgi:PAS domain S-box-containing protein